MYLVFTFLMCKRLGDKQAMVPTTKVVCIFLPCFRSLSIFFFFFKNLLLVVASQAMWHNVFFKVRKEKEEEKG